MDKTAQGYQEEGVIKLLKYIRDGLAGGNRPNGNVDDRPDGRPDRPDDRPDRPDDDISFNNLNNNINNKINNVQNTTNNYINLIRYQNAAINEFKKKNLQIKKH